MSVESAVRPDAVDLMPGLRSSTAFSALAGVVAAIVLSTSDSALTRFGLAAVGVVACGALVWASLRLRTMRVPSWTSRQRDPFLAFAGSLGLLVAAQSTGELSARSVSGGAVGSMVSAAAAILASAGFLLMIRDLTPGRAVDALLLAAMVATAAGLLGWVAAAPHLRGTGAEPGAWLLGSAALDLLTVALGVQLVHLRARARTTVALLLVAWTMVLSLDVARLLAHLSGESGSAGALAAVGILVCGLSGAAALHPSAVQSAEPIVGPRARLPRSQVALLVAVVLLGPIVLTLGRASGLGRIGVLTVVVGLSLLVVVYLVRLVQGRAMLEHLAHHDELTGLANGTLFHERAAAAIDHARRTGGHAAVLFLDLDRFKNVNDSLGHGMGNMLLQAVAKRLRTATRAEDTVARIGGDEFVIFLPQIADSSDAERVADEVLSRFKDPFVLAGHRLFASPSIGIAVFPDGGDGPDELLEHADTAMYRAKQRGRRTHCAFDPSMRKDAHQQLALENQLHGAIEGGELCLHYQPKIHLPTGRLTGMEALLRWDHPEHGLLQPDSFIPLAEESGLIVPLGEWAMEEACRQNQAWNAAGFAPLVVAVNLSLRQFQLESVEDMTARVLRATGLDPSLLELELTESLAMQDPKAVIATLRELKGLGVMCSIDDFGTGYSGLSHLTGFPVDKLKIDKSFVATIDGDREAPIVVAVVALAHGLGMEVVAEGVETRAQLDRLAELGCDEMQGFLFSRPLPAERFEQLLMLESVAGGPGRLSGARGPLLTIAG